MAALDASGKFVERSPLLLEKITAAERAVGLHMPVSRPRRANNLDLFRAASHHLADEKDLYAEYPGEQRDRFKYSPTFALLFTPLAAFSWGVSLFLWHLLNALALFYALTRVLKGRAADFAIAVVLPEVWRSMQSVQSNALVAATIVLAFVALERRKDLLAGGWISLGAAVKIFPVAALLFAAPTRRRWRVAALTGAALLLTLVLPLLVTPPGDLARQYMSWIALERSDVGAHMQSVMGLVGFIPVLSIPNLVFIALGFALLALPLALRPERWSNERFRMNALCTTLLFVVLFNPQAERASYVIAFTGIAIWFASVQRTYREHLLFWFAMLAIPIASLLIPGRQIRTPEMTVIRLVVPCVLIWARIATEMLSRHEEIRITSARRDDLVPEEAVN